MDCENFIQRLSSLDTCAVSDALDQLGLKGAVIGLKPLWPCGKIIGRTVTIKLKPIGLDTPTQHLGTAAIDAAASGDVLIVDNNGRLDVASWGGILSLASKLKSLGGVIIDGACRDVDEARELEFPVYARGAVQVTARGRIMQQSFNEEIQCGGVSVKFGDLVIADGSGVVFVPAAKAEEVISRAEAIAAQEKKMADAVRSGLSVLEVMEKMRYESMLTKGADQ